MSDFAAMRTHMVEGQILPNKVTDPRLIAALYELPRERFVAPARRDVAYLDDDLEIAPDRYLMEPLVLARLVQAVAPRPDEVALEIGAASGYGTALMARLAGTAIGLESDPALAARASELLSELEIDNAVVVEGALDAGYADQGPYDVILFGGGVSKVPEPILAQLAEGGRLAAVLGESDAVGRATLFTRVGGLIGRRVLFDASVRPLPGFEAAPGFVF